MTAATAARPRSATVVPAVSVASAGTVDPVARDSPSALTPPARTVVPVVPAVPAEMAEVRILARPVLVATVATVATVVLVDSLPEVVLPALPVQVASVVKAATVETPRQVRPVSAVWAEAALVPQRPVPLLVAAVATAVRAPRAKPAPAEPAARPVPPGPARQRPREVRVVPEAPARQATVATVVSAETRWSMASAVAWQQEAVVATAARSPAALAGTVDSPLPLAVALKHPGLSVHRREGRTLRRSTPPAKLEEARCCRQPTEPMASVPLVTEVEWVDLGRRASFVSHRLVGWIYWDPRAIELNAALGIPNGLGYYVTSRAAPLLPAGADVVSATFYSISPSAIRFAVDLAAQHTDWRSIYDARNQAVGEGLRAFVPEICDALSALGPNFWRAADEIPESGRPLFAAHRSAPRVDDPLVSAWLGVNCLREWRGDTHFAILLSEGIDRVQAGILHDAHLNYGGWIPRSRGADDAALANAFAALEARGLATNGVVNDAGLALRDRIEDRTNEICVAMWQVVGEEMTREFVELMEPVGQRLLARIDETAGPDWMPAARERRP